MQYRKLCEVFLSLEEHSKRLDKIRILAQCLRSVAKDDLPTMCLLLQGRVFVVSSEDKIGVASKLIVKALVKATGSTEEQIISLWKQKGDLGLVAFDVVASKSQQTLFSTSLTTEKVLSQLQKLVTVQGQGAVDKKMGFLAELLTSATSLEAKYIVKTVLADMRFGVGDGVFRDAVYFAFLAPDILDADDEKTLTVAGEHKDVIEQIQDAYNICHDFGRIATVLHDDGIDGLSSITLALGVPLKVMLGPKEETIEAALDRVGRPCAIENKYDGFRVQIHKDGDTVTLFTRRLENVTLQFPDIVAAVQKHVTAKQCIIDSEAVGFDPKTMRHRAFQEISQRIKRKYDIDEIAHKFPVEVHAFDLLFLDGKSLLQLSFEERRKKLESVIDSAPQHIVLSEMFVTDDVEKIASFNAEALASGYEGIMFKSLSSPYKPGGRIGHMVKFKPIMETLDLVIVGAERGEGKRAGWFSSFLVACQSDDGELMDIGRVSTGLKEKSEEGTSFEEMTALLEPQVLSEKDRFVTVSPSVVIEVAYEEVQQSPSYSSGYALRFPRFVRLRDDKSLDDVSSISVVERLYAGQRGRNGE